MTFISCDDRIGKILHNICISAVAMSLKWATRGPCSSCFFFQPWNILINSWMHISYWQEAGQAQAKVDILSISQGKKYVVDTS